MGISFTIGASTFNALAGPVTGKYALDQDAPPANVDIIRYHVKGVDGSYLSRNGFINYELTFKVRYISLNPYDDMANDRSAWTNTPIQITDYAGDVWKRCTIKDKGMRKLGPSRAVGGGKHQLDVIVEFIADQLPNT